MMNQPQGLPKFEAEVEAIRLQKEESIAKQE